MKKIIITVVLLIIAFNFFIIFSKFTSVSNLSNSLYNGDKWANYRLGDVYLQSKYDRIYDPTYHDNVLYHKEQFPNSIANQYINKNTHNEKNYKLLQYIIESMTIDKLEYPDTLFLHIRIGDVICVKDDEWINKVNGPMYYSKVGDTIWWDNVLNYIKSKNITKVVILSGSHTTKCLIESAKYLEDRKKFLEKAHLKVKYRIGQSPDEDLVMCYYVKHFITTGGGYGNMIKEIKLK